MACLLCCRLPPDEEKNPLIVDVIEVLRDEAWRRFKVTLGYCRRKLIRRSNYIIEVPENYFAFDQIGKPRFDPVDRFLGNCLGNIKAISTSNLNKEKTQNKSNGSALAVPSGDGVVEESRDKEKDDGRPDQAVSLDTTFNNGTGESQTYQFRFSKVRTSKLDVSYQKGFTVGGKASFSIGLPKALASGSLGLSAEKRLEVKKTQGQSFEESMTMEATSDIKVTPNSKYVAKVQLEERLIHAKFQVRIRMSMPQGRAPIYIRRRSDNVVVCVHNVTDLEDIFLGDLASFPSARKVDEDEDGGGDVVDFVVEGVVKGNLACDHTIDLSSEGKEDANQNK